MIILRADNRSLVKGQSYSFLLTNYQAGVSVISVINTSPMAVNDFVLIGTFGSETAEIIRITAVDGTLNTLTLVTPTKFAHPESTKALVVPYDQVGFYHTAAPTFSAVEDILSEYTNVEANQFYTTFSTDQFSSGFGWWRFRNSWTSHVTGPSNAIPFADFAINTVSFVLDSFYSMLNQGDLKLISNEDAMTWINEAYAVTVNELNLVEEEYLTAPDLIINVVGGVVEYDLPADFSNVISLYTQNDPSTQFWSRKIENISLDNVGKFINWGPTDVRYYLRNMKIGFVPTPSSPCSYILKYDKKAVRLTSLYDTIDLPDNNFYMLKDFMMFRASQKLGKPQPMYMDTFKQGIDRMKVVSIKRSDKRETFTPSRTSII